MVNRRRTAYNLLKGLPVSATDPNNQTSYFFYDQYNRLTRKEDGADRAVLSSQGTGLWS
jgi:YD repeat-containing protein